jgi:hypothetical protein
MDENIDMVDDDQFDLLSNFPGIPLIAPRLTEERKARPMSDALAWLLRVDEVYFELLGDNDVDHFITMRGVLMVHLMKKFSEEKSEALSHT